MTPGRKRISYEVLIAYYLRCGEGSMVAYGVRIWFDMGLGICCDIR